MRINHPGTLVQRFLRHVAVALEYRIAGVEHDLALERTRVVLANCGSAENGTSRPPRRRTPRPPRACQPWHLDRSLPQFLDRAQVACREHHLVSGRRPQPARPPPILPAPMKPIWASTPSRARSAAASRCRAAPSQRAESHACQDASGARKSPVEEPMLRCFCLFPKVPYDANGATRGNRAERRPYPALLPLGMYGSGLPPPLARLVA